MNRYNLYLITFAMTVCFAACSKEPDIQVAGDITIDASIGRMTKVSADGTNFTAGDAIALYAWTGDAASVPGTRVVDGVVNTFDGNRWNPASMMRWGNNGVEHYFLGIFPAPANVSNFTEAGYKLDPADYTASDLLVATNLNGVTPSNGTVSLTFEHVMAKLGVNIKFNDEFASDPEVTNVSVSARKNATVNYLTGSVTATGDESYVLLSAQDEPATGYKKSYSGIQVPQTISHITVIVEGKTYTYDSPTGITLTSGKQTNVGLIIGRKTMELATMSVTDWGQGEILADANTNMFYDYNGHEYVDMGLSVKWATCNVGADKPDECGAYFAWGETEPKNRYNWSTYKYCNWSNNMPEYGHLYNITKYCNNGYYGYDGFKDNKITLDPEDDAAHIQWGGDWRMPTLDEYEDLKYNCYWYWKTTDDGYNYNGYIAISKINGNSIFLPAVGLYDTTTRDVNKYGYYWSSSLVTAGPDGANILEFKSSWTSLYDPFYRSIGMPIRPVCP